MPRLLLTSIISLSLGMSVIGAFVPSVHAQNTPTTPATPTTVQAPSVFDAIGNEAAQQRAQNANGDDSRSSDEKKPMSWVTQTFNSAFVAVMTAIMTIFAWLLGIAMVMLDYSVLYTVVHMGAYVKNLSAIGVTWEILRNVGNIALIFGFLAIGIATILNANWYGGKQMIPRLIMGAVLLNFSLFMTEAVIDVGNFLATRVYTQINGGVSAGVSLSATTPGTSPGDSIIGRANDAVASTASSVNNEAISNKIMNQLGLQRLYGDALNGNKELLKENNVPLVAMLGILLFMVLAFVMFFLSFVLISRFVYLIYAIIVAPVGVVGFVIPHFENFGKNWFKNLVIQSMTAPVMLLLLYVALRIITDASFLGFGTPPDYTGFIQDAQGNFNLSGFANILISFFIAIGSLLGVIYGTKKFGAFGSSFAMKTAGKLSFGLAAWTARNTAGLGSQYLSKAIRTSSLNKTKTGRLFAGGFDRVATGSLDIRGSKWGSSALKTLDIEAGDVQKGGYRGARDESAKQHQEYIKSVDTAVDEKNAGEVSRLMKVRGEAEKAAESLTASISGTVKPLEELAKKQGEEVNRLKKEVEQNKNSGIAGPERERRDKETIEKLESTQMAFDATQAQIKEVKKPLSEAKSTLENAEGAEKKFSKEVSSQKKATKLAYAENIRGSLSSLIFGSGARMAANKIVKDSLKKEDKLDAIKKLLNEGEKPKEGVPGEEKPKEVKPKEGGI